jgi:hypothetical protein
LRRARPRGGHSFQVPASQSHEARALGAQRNRRRGPRPDTQWATERAEACGRLPASAECRLWPCAGTLAHWAAGRDQSDMVRKGSPVRVRQRALETALQRGFLDFRAAPVTTSRRSGRDRRFRSTRGASSRARCGACCRGGTPMPDRRLVVHPGTQWVPFRRRRPVSTGEWLGGTRPLTRFGLRGGSKASEGSPCGSRPSRARQ